jgi:hypothetical protein
MPNAHINISLRDFRNQEAAFLAIFPAFPCEISGIQEAAFLAIFPAFPLL